ncbi:MAG: hypothetical protein WA890_16630 [Micromonospora sp.]
MVLSYVRWYWADEDIWAYDELDADRWSLRHVEVRRRDDAPPAAAALAEVIAARDAGDLLAVSLYEGRHGVVPEAPFPPVSAELDPPLDEISAAEFEELWRRARRVIAGEDDGANAG